MSEALMNVASVTGGSVYSIVSASDLTYQKGEEIYTPPQFIGEDSDGDTIPDIVEEYGLKPNGQPIGTNKLLKDTDGDGLDDNVELRFSVDNFKNDMDNDNRYYCRALYLSTDPTKKDTDGDFDWDNVDPHPLKYQLNDAFIYKIEQLEELAFDYTKGLTNNSKYSVPKKYWLTMMFIRHFNEDYTVGNWPVVGGDIDYDFVNYVQNQNGELYSYFADTQSIYANENGELADLKHLAATFNVYAYKTDLYDAKYFAYAHYDKWYHIIKNAKTLSKNIMKAVQSEMFEYNFDNLGGWAGDLQTLMIEAYDEVDGSDDYDQFYNAFYNLIGHNSFSMDDMYADTDAYNIYVLLENNFSNSLADAFRIYFSKGYRYRYSTFTNNLHESAIRDLVETYTSTTYIVDFDFLRWPLFTVTKDDGTIVKYKFSDIQSKAATDAFVDYLMEQINNEK